MLTLVEQGQARAVLVLPDTTQVDEELAARELRTYIEKMSGVRLQIVREAQLRTGMPSGKAPQTGMDGRSGTAPRTGSDPRIVKDSRTGIGPPVENDAHTGRDTPTGTAPHADQVRVLIGSSLNPHAAAQLRRFSTDPDAFVLSVEADRVRLAGNSPEGTLFAAYELLERLGVRWYMPGDLGTVVPHSPRVALAVGRTEQAPSFPSRHLQTISRDFPWYRRQRLGGAYFPSAHGISLLPSADFQKEPELFALVDGKRSPRQLCVSNPEVVERAAAFVLDYFDQHPEQPWIGMGPNDGGGFCQCDRCRALDSGEWDPYAAEPSVTDRYIWFFDQVLQRVHVRYPDKKICFYAYHAYMLPPRRQHPDPHIVPAFAPIDFCRIHGLTNPICPDRSSYAGIMAQWGKLVPEIFERGYYFNLADPGFPFSKVQAIRQETPYAYQAGVTGWRVECMPSWATDTPTLYVAARLMWDVDVDVDGMLDEFYQKFFGPAAGPMGRYLELVDRAYRDTDCHTGGSFCLPRIFPAERREEARSLLAEAARRTAERQDADPGRGAGVHARRGTGSRTGSGTGTGALGTARGAAVSTGTAPRTRPGTARSAGLGTARSAALGNNPSTSLSAAHAALAPPPAHEVYARRVWMYQVNFERLEAFLDMLEARNRLDFRAAHEDLERLNELTRTLLDFQLYPAPSGPAPLGKPNSRLDGQARPLWWRSALHYIDRFWSPCTQSGYERTAVRGELAAGAPDEWDFLIDPTDVGETAGWFRDGTLGGNWRKMRTTSASWSDQGLHYYKGIAWYRTQIDVPRRFEHRTLYLWFGGVDEEAKVWLNGKLLGTSTRPGDGLPGAAGTFLPFEFDATDAVRFDRSNTLTVRIENKRLDEVGTGGIVAPVMFWSPRER